MAPDKPLTSTWLMAGWEVLGRIARGSTADVLLARPSLSGEETPASLALGLVSADRRVALKRLYPHLAQDEDFVKSFVDEVRLMSLLRHQSIVDVLDLDEDDETCFAVLELVDGPSLSAALRLQRSLGRGPVPVAVATAIIARVAEALQVVHQACDPTTGEQLLLVHRDVNPQNLLVGRDGAVKLADFGVARSAPGRKSGVLAATITKVGVLKGKFSFMSPEQVRGDVVDARSDLFALGATLYLLLTGSLPFVGATDVDLFEAILQQAPPKPSQLRPDPEVRALDELVMALLAKDPARRPNSAVEVQSALSRVEEGVVASFVVGLGLPSLRAPV